jgi:hypothetical protein
MTEIDVGWIESLDAPDRVIAHVALRAYEKLVMVGGCYYLTFFLHQLLKTEFSIETEAVVGWVCDGTSELMASHAWLESATRITDIALHRTEFPEIQLPGDLMILDRVIASGVAQYTYHRQRSPEAERAARAVTDTHQFEGFERLHASMARTARSATAIEGYLAKAPPDQNYRSARKALDLRYARLRSTLG